MNASWLLAKAFGVTIEGDSTCFYCGNPADRIFLDLKSSFNEWWTVANPDSDVICAGCEIALREKIEIQGKDKLQKTRNYSWFITKDKAIPFDKGQKSDILECCLRPLVSPWALSIAVSGQKHVIYRTLVNTDDNPPFIVQCETEKVVYTPDSLKERIGLAKLVTSAIGKPALADFLDSSRYMMLYDYHGQELAEKASGWWGVQNEPLSQLASFLCPAKEECRNELSTSGC